MNQETNTELREPTEQDLACGTATSDLAVEYGVTAKTITNWLNSASIQSHRNGKKFVVLSEDLPRFRQIADARVKTKVQDAEVVSENTTYIEQGFSEENSNFSSMIRQSIEEGRDLAFACQQGKFIAFTETTQKLSDMIWGKRNDLTKVKPPSLDEVRHQLNSDRAIAQLMGGVA